MKQCVRTSNFFHIFARTVEKTSFSPDFPENQGGRRLTIDQKYWILEHAQKYKDLSAQKIAVDFKAEFGRRPHYTTIQKILKQEKEIREKFDKKFALWKKFKEESDEVASEVEPDNNQEEGKDKEVCVKIEENPLSYAKPKNYHNQYLSIGEKFWIVDHADKICSKTVISRKLLQERLILEFTAEFGLTLPTNTVMRILNQKQEIREKFALWKRFKEKSED